MRVLPNLIAIVALLTSTPLLAQAITSMTFIGQAAMLAPSGRVSACGLRFVGLAPDAPNSTSGHVVDGSITIHRNGMATVKAGHYWSEARTEDRLPAPSGRQVAWVRTGSLNALTPDAAGLIDGEDAGFFLFRTDFKTAADSIIGVFEGEPLWIGFKGGAERDAIFAGPVDVRKDVSAQFSNCLDQLLKSISK